MRQLERCTHGHYEVPLLRGVAGKSAQAAVEYIIPR